MPTTQTIVKQPSRTDARSARDKFREKLRVNSGCEQKQRGDRHADEKFHLMMQQSAIIQKPDYREEGRAGENADYLPIRNRREAKTVWRERIRDRWQCRRASGIGFT